MTNNVSESRFYMWRAIFALAHADHIVTDEEYRFMQKALDTENFQRHKEPCWNWIESNRRKSCLYS